MINFLYRGSALPADYKACNDIELIPTLSNGVPGKNTNCLRWDVGDPVNWLIAYAQSGNGVESDLAPFGTCMADSNIGELRRGLRYRDCDVLHELGLVLSPTSSGSTEVQRRRAKQFLCGLKNRDEIMDALKQDLQISIDCLAAR